MIHLGAITFHYEAETSFLKEWNNSEWNNQMQDHRTLYRKFF